MKNKALNIVVFALKIFLGLAVSLGIGRAGINEWTSLLPDAKAPYNLVLDPVTIGWVYYLANFSTTTETYTEKYFPCRSNDEGAAWELIMTGLPPNFQADSLAGTAEEPFLLYMSGRTLSSQGELTGCGIYRSADRGESWQEIFEAPWDWQEIYGLTVHPDRTTIFAGVFTESGSYLIRSPDAGTIWIQKCELADTYTDSFQIAISRDYPDTVYCVPPAILKSCDRGETWETTDLGLYGWENGVSVSGQDPDHVYVTFLVYSGQVILRSEDGGKSWYGYGPFGLLSYVHLFVHPANEKIAVIKEDSGAGLWVTQDGGEIWMEKIQNISSAPFPPAYSVRPSYPETIYVTGGGIQKTTDWGSTWTALVPVSDHGHGYVHPYDPNFYLIMCMGGSGYGSYGIFRSTNAGASWLPGSIGIERYVSGVTDFNTDVLDYSVLYLGLDGTYVSKDKGNSWKSNGFSGHENRIKASRLKTGKVYAIMNKKTELRMSEDFCETWTTISVPNANYILDVEEGSEAILYVTGTVTGSNTKMAFWKSADGGATWEMKTEADGFITDSHSGLAKIVIDPHDNERLFVGAMILLVSENEGENWSRFTEFKYASHFTIDPSSSQVMYSSYRSVDGGKTWSDWGSFSYIGFFPDDSNHLYSSVNFEEMQIASSPPKIQMGGFLIDDHSKSKRDLFITAIGSDSDTNDFITSIEIYYLDENLGINLYPDGEGPAKTEGSSFFYRLIQLEVEDLFTSKLRFRAKDYFGNLSDEWPKLNTK